MKSQELREFHLQLSRLNNGFTHYFFVWTQFDIDYSKVIIDHPEDITKDYFKANKFAPKHSVRLKELPNEHIKTNYTLIEGIFILTISYFELYLKRIFEFSQKIDNTITNIEVALGVEEDTLLIEKIINRLNIAKESIGIIYFVTFDYLRLKRNRLIHKSSQNISKSIRELIKLRGKDLNEFWNKTLPKGLQGVDFNSQENMNSLEFELLIDTINILRVISNKIDSAIINKLGIEKISKNEIVPNFLSEIKRDKTSLVEDKVQKKFAGFCRTKYGFEPGKVFLKHLTDDIA